jgi:hypothetical protein
MNVYNFICKSVNYKYSQNSSRSVVILNIITNTPVTSSSYPIRLFYFDGYTADLTVTYKDMSETLTFRSTKSELWGYTTTKDKPFD